MKFRTDFFVTNSSSSSYLVVTFDMGKKGKFRFTQDGYFGCIWSEGYGLKDDLKVVEEGVKLTGRFDNEVFSTPKEFIEFIAEDLWEDFEFTDFLQGEYGELLDGELLDGELLDKVSSFSDIKEIKVSLDYHDTEDEDASYSFEESIRFV